MPERHVRGCYSLIGCQRKYFLQVPCELRMKTQHPAGWGRGGGRVEGRKAWLSLRVRKTPGDGVTQTQPDSQAWRPRGGAGEQRGRGWGRPGPGAENGIAGKVECSEEAKMTQLRPNLKLPGTDALERLLRGSADPLASTNRTVATSNRQSLPSSEEQKEKYNTS